MMLHKSNPCRGCPTRICLSTCEDKKKWLSDAEKGIYPNAVNLPQHREAKTPRTFDLPATIEALKLGECMIREVRQGLEEKLRGETQAKMPKVVP